MINSLSSRYWSAPSRLVNGYLPSETPAVPPVQPSQPASLDVPHFMKRPHKRPEKPDVKEGRQSFKEILAEAERILR